MSTSVTTGGGFGAPAATFGAATAQPGVWNNFVGAVSLSLSLVDLTGAPSGVTLTRNTAAGGDFGFNNANATGDFGLLLNDGQCGPRIYTFTGLAAGLYDIYTYAIAPDSALYVTGVNVTGSTSPNPQNIGGAMPVNAFALGVTHARHTVMITAGSPLTVTTTVVTTFATNDGFQITPGTVGPPANDSCGSAFALSGSGSAAGTTTMATNDGSASCGAAGLPDVWYSYTGPVCVGTLALNSAGTVLSAYTGACGALTEVGCNASGALSLPTTPGTAYRIRVATSGAPGAFTLNYSFTATTPANDVCANAEALIAGTYTRSNCGAGTDGTATCGGARTSDVWFSYSSSCDYTAIIDTCGTHDLPGADLGIDTVVSVYTACGGTQLACNDDYSVPAPFGGCTDPGIIRDSAVSVALTAGQTVLIRVASFSTGPQGTFILRIQAPPVVTIVAASPPNLHRDTLQNTDTALIAQGIGVIGTPDEGTVTNYGQPQVTFSAAPSPIPAPGNITVMCTGGVCPTVTGVAGAGAGPYTLTLSGQIPPLHCITFAFACTAAGQKLQYSSGPGDTNLNSSITGQDVLAEVTAINTSTTILARHDTNRNGTVTGQDVLRLVQLLNGGVSVSPNTGYNGSAVAACP